jgi:hypothetical protein
MSKEHSKCFGYWKFGCTSLETAGPNTAFSEVVSSGSIYLKNGNCDLM